MNHMLQRNQVSSEKLNMLLLQREIARRAMSKQRAKGKELRVTPPILPLARGGARRGFRKESKKRIFCNSMLYEGFTLIVLCCVLMILCWGDFGYAQTG